MVGFILYLDNKILAVEWYALHSKPNKEELLWGQLAIRWVETYYPRARVQIINPQARKIRPCFPGYVFVRVYLERTGISTFYLVRIACESVVEFLKLKSDFC
jgi:hypothetical protein